VSLDQWLAWGAIAAAVAVAVIDSRPRKAKR
jgi:hypothetical protein